jgi:hypothetical protein
MTELCGYCQMPLKGQLVYELMEYRDAPVIFVFGDKCCIATGNHVNFRNGQPSYYGVRADDANLELIYKDIDAATNDKVRYDLLTLSYELEHKLLGPILEQIEKDLAHANKILGIKKKE